MKTQRHLSRAFKSAREGIPPALAFEKVERGTVGSCFSPTLEAEKWRAVESCFFPTPDTRSRAGSGKQPNSNGHCVRIDKPPGPNRNGRPVQTDWRAVGPTRTIAKSALSAALYLLKTDTTSDLTGACGPGPDQNGTHARIDWSHLCTRCPHPLPQPQSKRPHSGAKLRRAL